MKILITGSSGFIGSALKDFFKDKDIDIVEYDIRNDPKQDVRDFEHVFSRVKNVEGVIHLAAVSRVKIAFETPLLCVAVNVGGTENILEAARRKSAANNGKSPWVIFASSREVFGEPEHLPVTETSPRSPINVYGVAKVAGEDLCRIYTKDYGLRTRVLRFSNAYSSIHDQFDRVVPTFILRAAKNEDIAIHGKGEETFDFTYIDDTVQGIWQCVQEISDASSPEFDDFNISTGKPVTLRELAEVAVEATKSKSSIIYQEARSYDVSKFYGDPKKAMERLGFSPRTEIRAGISAVTQEFKRARII